MSKQAKEVSRARRAETRGFFLLMVFVSRAQAKAKQSNNFDAELNSKLAALGE
jgi:hypothetical protein